MRCVVRDCRSLHNSTTGIMFHSFPKDPGRRATWLNILPLKGKFYKCARICSLHFKPDQYDLNNRLIKNATPFYCTVPRDHDYEKTTESFHTTQPHCHADHASKENTALKPLNTTDIRSTLADLIEAIPGCSENSESAQNVLSVPILHTALSALIQKSTISTSVKALESIPGSSKSVESAQVENVLSAPILHSVLRRSESSESAQPQNVLRAPIPYSTTSTSVKARGYSKRSDPPKMSHPEDPAVKRLRMSDAKIQVTLKTDREEVLLKTKKILHQKIARQKLQICNLKSLIDVVRNYTFQSEIENIVHGNFSEMCRLFKQKEKKTKGVRFSKEVKAFALTMHFYSPKAYEHLRTVISLPHSNIFRAKARKRTLPVVKQI